MRHIVIALLCLGTVASSCARNDEPAATELPSVATTNAPIETINDPVDVDPDATATRATTTAPAPTTTIAAVSYDVSTIDGEVADDSRDRMIPYRVYAPAQLDGDVPVIVVSHGGLGSETGFTRGEHLGSTFAAGGFVAIHIGHLPSASGTNQRFDRPADVTALLDHIEAGELALPDDFTGTIDMSRVGHAGHSYGAYTGHAVGGADYGADFVDERVDAIAPISPQGADQFGAFDNGTDDNTWMSVDIPAYNLIGGAELDGNVTGTINEPGWRLIPFERYPSVGDKFVTIIDDQEHSDMWSTGSEAVESFIAGEILEFWNVYVAGRTDVDACDIGQSNDASITGSITWSSDRIADPSGAIIDC